MNKYVTNVIIGAASALVAGAAGFFGGKIATDKKYERIGKKRMEELEANTEPKADEKPAE